MQPDEQGVALVLGKVWKLTNPGLNYNLPAPIGEVFTSKVTRVNRVGSASARITASVRMARRAVTGLEDLSLQSC